jgi:hypothetical protein
VTNGDASSATIANERSFLVLLLVSRMIHETTLWNASRPDNLIYVAAVFLPVLFRFHSIAILVSLGVNLFSAIDELPYAPNHSVLALVVTLATALFYSRKLLFGGELAILKPFCGAVLALMYFWAGFHKLNTDFFFPESSCVGIFAQLAWSSFDVGDAPEFPPAFIVASAVATVVLELLAGLLLFSRRWLWLGAGCAFLLHVPLSFSGFYNFAALAFAVLTLVLQPGSGAAGPVTLRYGVHLRVLRYAVWNSLGALLALVLTALRGEGSGEPQSSVEGLLRVVLDSATEQRVTAARASLLLLSGAAILWPLIRSSRLLTNGLRLRPSGAWGYLGCALLCLFAGSPYLGLSTSANFSMFSNLRTEGARANHLLLSSNPFKVFRYQEDLVQLIEFGDEFQSLDPEFEQPRYEQGQLIYQSINLLRLRYLLRSSSREGAEQTPLTLRYRGETREFSNILDDPFFAPEAPGLLSYVLTFRSFDTAPRQSCKW